MSEKPISPLRQRMIEDMTVRNFVEKTRNDYIRHVKTFTASLGRSPDTATAEDLRCFQLHQTKTGVRPPTINGSVVALRFFFTVTVGRAAMARHLQYVGFVEPDRRMVEQLWHHDTSDQLFDVFNEGAVRATAMLRSQPDEARETIRAVVRSQVEQLRQGDHYVIPVPAALSWARKP